jgi:hypothetical protein
MAIRTVDALANVCIRVCPWRTNLLPSGSFISAHWNPALHGRGPRGAPRGEGIGRRGECMGSWSRMDTPSSRSRLRPTATWACRPSAFSDSLARRRRRQGARLASPALWRLPSRSLAKGCAGVTIRCIGHRWACVQRCLDVGSVMALLTPRRRCGNRYECTDLHCVPWTDGSVLRDAYVWSS